MDVDVIVVGGGHNGLACAGYLARAGLSTVVVERREIVGGCATSEALVPDQPRFLFNGGATELLAFRDQPVYRDLELERHGLELLDSDPMFVMPFPDGTHVMVHRSVERTAESIARISPRDAEAYVRLHDFWGRLDGVLGSFAAGPAPLSGRPRLSRAHGRRLRGRVTAAAAALARRRAALGAGRRLLRSPDAAEMARVALMPARQYLEEQFESPQLRALAAFFAMQTKTPLDAPGSAFGMAELPWSHAGGVTRPRGGMGRVSEALANALRAHGGEILLERHVEEILVRGGRAVGVRTADGEQISARRAVVTAISPVRVFLRLVAREHLDPRFRRRVEHVQVDNTGVIKCFYALREAPVFSRSGDDGSDPGFRTAAGMFCPGVAEADRMWHDIAARRLPRDFGWGWCTHASTLDPTMAPPGCHTLGLHVWVPVELADGRSWDEHATTEMAMRMLDQYARCAPNVKDALIAWSARTPRDYETVTDNPNGNMFHVDYTPHQSFGLRPLPELAAYRAPVRGLYLSGAGMHPGPAVTGLPGHNTAHAVLEDLA
jgi:phytoene dehydrogenase-like protein